MITKLSVNINKFATLRNARGGDNPDVVEAAKDCQTYGAQGITVHPRGDERHIRRSDVYALKPVVVTEFNIEGFPDEAFLLLCEEVQPTQVTLVPDGPDVLTSNAGWDCIQHGKWLNGIVSRLHQSGIRTSLFIDPVDDQIRAAKQTGTDRIELYTEAYASHYASNRMAAVDPYRRASELAKMLDMGLNAGHDLNSENLRFFKDNVVDLLEVSIGHALICEAIYFGLHNTIVRYLNALNPDFNPST